MPVFEKENQIMQSKKQVFCFAFFCFFVLLFSFWTKLLLVKAAVNIPPPIITYQGKLLDAGAPVDTTTTMGFLIYDAATDGDILYTAAGTTEATSTIEVPVVDSIFSIDLGEGDTNAIDKSIFTQNTGLYLEVWVGDTVLSPRKLLTTAPYAFNSAYLMGYGVATASTSEYIPRSNFAGNFTFTGNPISSGVSGGTVYINPASAGAGKTLFGVAVGGEERFRVDKNGNAWIVGALTATGTAQSVFTELAVTNGNGITLGGVRRTSWPSPGGTGDVVSDADNTFTGENTFTATTTLSGQTYFDGLSYFSQTADMQDLFVNGGITLGGVERTTWPTSNLGDVVAADDNTLTGQNSFTATTTLATSTISELFVTNGITLGGVRQTTWPAGGGVGDVVAADNNGFLGVNTFSSTSTFNGPVSFTSSTYFSSTSTMDDLIVTNSITLGGVERTTWPTSNLGDVVAADDNMLTGQNSFTATTTLATSTISELFVTNGITLGGVRQTTWPAGGGVGDVVAANDNTFTGINVFDGRANFNGDLNSGMLSSLAFDPGATDITSFDIQGNYAFYVSANQDTLTVVDVSGSGILSQVGTLTDNTSLDGASDIAVQGNYAYILSANTAKLTVVDISDPTTPVIVGTLTSALSLLGSNSIVVNGSYAYVAATVNDKFTIVNISNPLSPVLAGTLSDGAGASPYLDGINDIYISGNYAFVTALYSDAVNVIDISDKNNPTYITAARDNLGGFTALDEPHAITGIGNYIFVGTNAEGVQIINISDPSSLSVVSTYNVGGGINSLFATYNYLYIRAQEGYFVLDISDPWIPVEIIDQAAGPNHTQNGVHSIFVKGNTMYVSLYESDEFDVYDISTAVLASVDIGAAKVSNLVVDGAGSFGGNVDIREGLSVGSSGFLLNGDFSLFAPTSDLSATNTLNFSHTALFRSSAATTEDHIFVFDTVNSITSGGSNYLFSVRNNGTSKFSIATNGDTHAAGTLYAASNVVGMPGTPGDLAERVDIAFDDEVEPGDVVVVDPNNTDTYRRSSSAYTQEVSGVISTNPTIVVGDGRTENTAVMAMVGRVPIKVSNENGPISRGDLLVTASQKGYAMKYDVSKEISGHVAAIVGVALEGLSGESGKIMGLVRTGWVDGGAQDLSEIREELGRLALAQTNMSLGPGVSVEEKSDGTIGTVETDFSLNGFSLLAVKSVHGENNKWTIDEEGRFITTVETSDGEKTLYALQTGESQYVFSGNGQLVQGHATIEFDPSIGDIVNTDKAMSINLTLTAKANGIFVSKRTSTGFEVEEMNGGTSDATFDWLVFATRKGENDEVTTSTPEEIPVEEVVSTSTEENSNPDADVSSPPNVAVEEAVVEEGVVENPAPEAETPVVEEPALSPIEEQSPAPDLLPESPVEEEIPVSEPLVEPLADPVPEPNPVE